MSWQDWKRSLQINILLLPSFPFCLPSEHQLIVFYNVQSNQSYVTGSEYSTNGISSAGVHYGDTHIVAVWGRQSRPIQPISFRQNRYILFGLLLTAILIHSETTQRYQRLLIECFAMRAVRSKHANWTYFVLVLIISILLWLNIN